MRYSTLISAAVAVSFFGLTTAQATEQDPENCNVYTSVDQYFNDLPNCTISCWDWLVTYYGIASTCGDTVDLECLCATPEPDVNNSTYMGLYEGSYDCMRKNCTETDVTQFAVAASRFVNTCAQMKANGTVSATPTATADSAATAGAGADASATYAPGATDSPGATGAPAATDVPSATEAPVATDSPVFTETASGFATYAVPTGTAADINASGSPTDTAVIAQQTVNAAGKGAISNWEMAVGLPLVAGLMVMQFL